MYLIVQLFLLDNITIHLGFLLEQRNFSSLGRKKKRRIIWSRIYMNCPAVSYPQPAVQRQFFFLPHGFDCKFTLPLLQRGVTGVGGLCLEKQTIDLSESRCVCDFIGTAVREITQTAKVKAKWLRTLRRVCFALPLSHSFRPLCMYNWRRLSQNVIEAKKPPIF